MNEGPVGVEETVRMYVPVFLADFKAHLQCASPHHLYFVSPNHSYRALEF